MSDPVMDPDGNTYEREAILTYLANHAGKTPTGRPTTASELTTDDLLRSLIEKAGFQVKHPKVEPFPDVDVADEAMGPEGEAVAGPAAASGEKAAQCAIELEAVACVDPQNPGNALVACTLLAPKGMERTPTDLCCVIDVSGSMGAEATVQDAGSELAGLSMLDIVKHATKTLVQSLQATDRISIVSYSSTATTVLELLSMDPAGKALAMSKIDDLRPGGNTNIWDGLHHALENLKTGANNSHFSHIMLLTDGMPNISPPRGHLPMLRKYKDENPQLQCTINTFGFGYNLDSVLLRDLAIEGHGMYAFIPDAGFVGTVFVNALSAILATHAMGVEVSIENVGAKLVPGSIVGGHLNNPTTWGAQVNLGTLQYDQAKNFVFSVALGQNGTLSSVTLKAETLHGVPVTCNIEVRRLDGALAEVEVHRCRLLAVDAIRLALDTSRTGAGLTAGQGIIGGAIATIKASPAAGDPRVLLLLEDLEGQVVQAFSRPDWFTKWGQHYLPSLMRAHLMQVCNNFKDPGIQIYSGALFSRLRDEADAIFLKLPPPTPSRRVFAPSGVGTVAPRPVDMSVYNNRDAGCISGESLVSMANGGVKRMRDLVKGDQVFTNGVSAEVVCLVKTTCPEEGATLVELEGGVRITSFHPVRVQGKWHFPITLGEPVQAKCDAVYNVVLSDYHILTVNGMECVSLGHGFSEEVVAHPFFGTEVVGALQQLAGWDDGHIDLTVESFLRDPITNMICGLQQ